jgi:NAD(P)-dependent dehydrogenase (short-subunit alcohol dehydrogenase family)
VDTGLSGKVTLVTGGSGAIGRAIALSLAAEGADVAVSWHTGKERAAGVVQEVARTGSRACAVRFDQSEPATAAAALAEVRAALGPVSVLIANAVQWPGRDHGEVDGLAASLTANVTGTIALIDAALADLRVADGGRIVIVSTDIVAQPMPGPLAYATAKGALESAARVLAVREARHGILTNVVRPGFTLTDRALTSPFLGPAVVDQEAGRTPTGRICTPEDVATAVTYLASAANGHVNGQVLSVAGGREMVR